MAAVAAVAAGVARAAAVAAGWATASAIAVAADREVVGIEADRRPGVTWWGGRCQRERSVGGGEAGREAAAADDRMLVWFEETLAAAVARAGVTLLW